MEASGRERAVSLFAAAVILAGCAREHDRRLLGSWAGRDGPEGLTFYADGSALQFELRTPLKPDYGSPLLWETSRRENLLIRTIDEEGNVGAPKSIGYRFEKDELVLSEGYPFGVPTRLKRKR